MDNLDNEFIQIHQEVSRCESYISQVLRQSGMPPPSLMDRGLSMLGDTLIRVGTRLKGRAYTRLTAEEASVPPFIITL
jgi:hypothetical protein